MTVRFAVRPMDKRHRKQIRPLNRHSIKSAHEQDLRIRFMNSVRNYFGSRLLIALPRASPTRSRFQRYRTRDVRALGLANLLDCVRSRGLLRRQWAVCLQSLGRSGLGFSQIVPKRPVPAAMARKPPITTGNFGD